GTKEDEKSNDRKSCAKDSNDERERAGKTDHDEDQEKDNAAHGAPQEKGPATIRPPPESDHVARHVQELIVRRSTTSPHDSHVSTTRPRRASTVDQHQILHSTVDSGETTHSWGALTICDVEKSEDLHPCEVILYIGAPEH